MDSNDSNGCGGKGGLIRPPHRLFFNASCCMHDVSYGKGGGWKERMKADQGFLRAMLSDCYQKKKVWRWYFKAWAWAFYRGVRLFGGIFFNWHNDGMPKRFKVMLSVQNGFKKLIGNG